MTVSEKVGIIDYCNFSPKFSPLFLASSLCKAGVVLQTFVGVASSSWLGALPRGKLTGRELVTELDGRELAQFCKHMTRQS